MATAVKLAVIGAGSATFSLPLVRDICLTPD
jgi:alpha-galactosidase/6-phospho-beta-glucosidase family protein